jgi:hypothetical protein
MILIINKPTSPSEEPIKETCDRRTQRCPPPPPPVDPDVTANVFIAMKPGYTGNQSCSTALLYWIVFCVSANYLPYTKMPLFLFTEESPHCILI